jgi:Fibronectin type III domain
MTKSNRGLAIGLAVIVTAVGAPNAAAEPVSVNVRVEGAARTIFDGTVTTDGHVITTPSSGGPRTCDGTNNGAHATPVPVATAALDDASRTGAFGWDGTYGNFGIDDFFLTRIADETADPNSEFWSLYVNRKSSEAGGCQKRVGQGDEVLWARISFLGPPTFPLELRAPGAARTGETVNAQVVDGETGAPQPGATVNGSPTGGDGTAALSFAEAGVYRLKAEKPGAIRSNSVSVCVDPPGADPCTSGDKAAPRVLTVDLPGKELATERGRSRTMVVSWQADDGDGAGVSYYSVDVREVASGVRASQADWRPVTERTATPSARFRGEPGKAYRFRVTAIDRATNRGTAESNTIVVPVDDRDRKLFRFSRGWERTPRTSAWGETVRRTTEAGHSATLRFRGRRVSLISRRMPKGGRLRVTVGGRSKVVNLRGRSGSRRVVWTSRRMRDGAHVLRIRSLGGGPVEVDAVAPRP